MSHLSFWISDIQKVKEGINDAYDICSKTKMPNEIKNYILGRLNFALKHLGKGKKRETRKVKQNTARPERNRRT